MAAGIHRRLQIRFRAGYEGPSLKPKDFVRNLRRNREYALVSISLTSAEKRALKSKAQLLEPIVKLGHAGMTDAFLQSLDSALNLHGLVKMKFTDFKEQKRELAPQIAEKTGSELIMQVGNVVVLYRRKPEREPN